MMDDASVLNVLARRAGAKPVEPVRSAVDTNLLDLYMRACAERDQAKEALAMVTSDLNKERAGYQAQIGDLTAKLNAVTTAHAEMQGKYSVLESRPPETKVERDDTALEALRAENADLRVRCATYEGRCSEMESSKQIQAGYISKLEARLASMEAEGEAEVETEAPEEPMEYDIEVIRGGDDRIRSLRVRCTE